CRIGVECMRQPRTTTEAALDLGREGLPTDRARVLGGASFEPAAPRQIERGERSRERRRRQGDARGGRKPAPPPPTPQIQASNTDYAPVGVDDRRPAGGLGNVNLEAAETPQAHIDRRDDD